MNEDVIDNNNDIDLNYDNGFSENKYKRNEISKADLDKATDIIRVIDGYYSERIVGQANLRQSLLTALIANGHILLESVPGLAKTTAAKVLTSAVGGEFSRIQCTPDLLPSDIIGTQTFNYQKGNFETKMGPINANFVLLDEINRSSAKTQSAMLEAMQERQVTIGGVIYKLPPIFIVIATQNPIEQEGTYPLPEAQLDRFLLKEVLDYPTPKEEIEVLNRIESNVINQEKQVIKIEGITFLQDLCKKVYVDESIKKYITLIVSATRFPEKFIDKDLAKYISCGSSTRACIAFMESSKAVALMNGRDYVTPDDIKSLKYNVLRHRIALNFAALADNVKVETIIDAIFGAIKTP